MEDSLLLQLMGKSPLLAIVDVLIDNKGLDLNKSEIMKESGLSRGTFFKFWPLMERNELVKKTRNLGRIEMFMLNSSNPIVEKLLELESFLIARSLETKHKKIEVTV